MSDTLDQSRLAMPVLGLCSEVDSGIDTNQWRIHPGKTIFYTPLRMIKGTSY
jgi:hypothetical protein